MGAHAEKLRRAIPSQKPKYSSSEPIAAIEKRVIDSAAFAALPGEAVRILILLARNLEKGRNGHIFITESFAGAHGLNRKTLYRHLKTLIAHQLVCMTKRGGNGSCSRYALTWIALSRDTKGLHAEHFSKDAWRSWQPSPKKSTVPKMSTAGGQKRTFAPELVDKNGQRYGDKNGTVEVIANRDGESSYLDDHRDASEHKTDRWIHDYLARLAGLGLADACPVTPLH